MCDQIFITALSSTWEFTQKKKSKNKTVRGLTERTAFA